MSISSIITRGFGVSPSSVLLRGYSIATDVPVLVSISPARGFRGTTRHVTLIGSGFSAGSELVLVSGTGITVVGTTVHSDSEIVADFLINMSAALTARDVTVQTSSGTSGAQPFTVSLSTPFVGWGESSQPRMITKHIIRYG
jgi:hypothetical protein